MTPDPELIGGTYLVCHACKEGKFERNDNLPDPPKVEWGNHHSKHGELELVIGTIFLADLLPKQYIDVDRPDLEPIVTHFGGAALPADAPLGTPGGAQAALELQKAMRARSTPQTKPKVIHVVTDEARLLAGHRLVLAQTRKEIDRLLNVQGYLEMQILQLEKHVTPEQEEAALEP